MTFAEFDELFPNNDACKQYLADRRWPDGVKCPRCGNPKIYTLKFKPFHWACGVCCNKPRQPYRFSVTVETIFENTNYPLLVWFKVLYLMLTSKKGISRPSNPSDDRFRFLRDRLVYVHAAPGRDERP